MRSIEEHKNANLEVKKKNEVKIKALSQKVAELSGQVDAHHHEIQAGMAMTVAQLKELVESVKHLSAMYNDKKGEK